MTQKIYNVLSREKEEFVPLQPGKVNIYVCGPTVYDYSHIGHAKTYVCFDVVVRYLRFKGFDVLYVQNLTDVGHLLDTGEDRILRKARQASSTPAQVVESYARIYFENMDALGVQRPDISPRASGHIPEQIEMIERLIERGYAYESNSSVYFDVQSWQSYGKLSGRRVEENEVGSRVAVNEEKRHPADFALWKNAEPEHIMRWQSPWGVGFPGWHIECSAMANKYLGANFDIHGGGIDNMFPHNECEIAQSEAANEQPFANYWMLVGSLTLDGVKMSKSLGNTLTIGDALQRWRPEAIRYFILTSHYSNPIDFSDRALDDAEKAWRRISGAVVEVRRRCDGANHGDNEAKAQQPVAALLDGYRSRFLEAMDDDFNAPAAIAVLQDLTRQVNRWLSGDDHSLQHADWAQIDAIYQALGGEVLGIVPQDSAVGAASAEREAGLIELLIAMRADARTQRDWAAADRIRNELGALGVQLLDGPNGTTWQLN